MLIALVLEAIQGIVQDVVTWWAGLGIGEALDSALQTADVDRLVLDAAQLAAEHGLADEDEQGRGT